MADAKWFQSSYEAAQRYEQNIVRTVMASHTNVVFDNVSLHEGERVLDVACGTGIVTRVAAERFDNVGKLVGLDQNTGRADREGAGQMAAAITSTLQLAATQPEWTPPVLLTRAEAGEGMEELWDKIQEHHQFLTESSQLGGRQEVRRKEEFLEAVEEEMGRRWRARVESDSTVANLLRQVADKRADPYSAALEFLDSYENSLE